MASPILGGRVAPSQLFRISRGALKVCADSKAKFWVGGNWKCNLTAVKANELAAGIRRGKLPTNVDVVCAPPFVYLHIVKDMMRDTPIEVAAQNCWTGNGAFTGKNLVTRQRQGGFRCRL